MSIFNQPRKSIWGIIQSTKEIGENVFMVTTTSHGGIMIPLHMAEEILSDKAIAMGVNESGYLHYEEDGLKHIPLYELIKNNYIKDPDIVDSYNLQEIEKDGHFLYPDYFGKFELPKNSAWGNILSKVEIMNGVSAIKIDDEVGLAVHQSVAYYQLSDQLANQGIPADDYLFYNKKNVVLLLGVLKELTLGQMHFSEEAERILGIQGIHLVGNDELNENNLLQSEDEDEPEL